MSHRIREQQIFAYLDGRLGPFRKKRLLGHLSTCEKCAAYLKKVKHLRQGALEALEVPDPDWSQIDPKVDQLIADAVSKRRPVTDWAPVALTLAAAAAVALAIVLPSYRETGFKAPSTPPNLDHPELQSVFADPKPHLLVARVVDTLAPNRPPHIGQQLAQGDEILITDLDSVRVALGPTASLEPLGRTKWKILSLHVDTPTVSVHRGRLLVSVPTFSFMHKRGLTILADGTSFYISQGIVEFIFEEDTIEINLFEGEIIADRGIGSVLLGPGMWKAARLDESAGSAQWIPIGSMEKTSVDNIATRLPLKERGLPSPATGTLPRQIIREVLKPSNLQIRSCYEKALKRDQNLTLALNIRIGVGRSGAVSSVRVSGLKGLPQLRRCIEGVLSSVRFPAPKGGPLELALPMRLHPIQ
ncbi:MAG: zf-HC2 domain-containing protein [Proteobacteria bacterium]|nr:zf-HC2 domain-containing protein [Pseudomonadota bacterium]